MRHLPGLLDSDLSRSNDGHLPYMGSSVMTMEQGSLYQTQLPLQNDYSLNAEPDGIDHYTTQQSYAGEAAVDQYRRDSKMPSHASNPFAYAAANHTLHSRYMPDRGVPSEPTSYQPGHSFPESSSGSISTSPSSGSSSLVPTYTGYQGNHYTAAIPSFPGPVTLAQSFVPSAYAGARVSTLFDSSTSGILPHPFRSSISHPVHASDPNSYTTSAAYLTRTQFSPHAHATYPSYADTRNFLSSGALSSSGTASFPSTMATNMSYGSSVTDASVNFPWPNLEVLNSDITCEGQPVTPNVHAKVEKGFFQSSTDQKWTCYRRNYFSVQCSFEINPNIENGQVYIRRNGKDERVQAMGLRLAAAVEGSSNKLIELIQHTPKRDAGPKTSIAVVQVAPTPTASRNELNLSPQALYGSMSTFHRTGHVSGVHLPLQGHSDSFGGPLSSLMAQPSPQPFSGSGLHYTHPEASHITLPGQNISHQFERVQFKQATANNGKRRASQQYFHLIIELMVDVRKIGDAEPVWVKIAQRSSEKIVVRGRSPSHYQNEGNHGAAGRNGSTGGGSGYGPTASGVYGNLNTGAFRSSTGGYGGSLSGPSGFRSHGFALPADSDHSASDPESMDEAALESDHPTGELIPGSERADNIQEHEGCGYTYYPSTLYDGQSQPRLPRLAYTDGAVRGSLVKAEYPEGVFGTPCPTNGCGRFQGVESSRGYYPDMSTG